MLRRIRRPRRAAAGAIAAAAALLLLPSTRASAAVVSVACTGINSTDVAALKAAITAANIATNQTLSLAAGCTFTLGTVDNGENGLPKITSTMVIQGNGDTITRSTAANTPAFRFFEDSTLTPDLTLTGLTLTHGDAAAGGGAILSVGPLHISDSHLIFNNTTADGGAILDSGVATISDSSISSNTAATSGGGIASNKSVDNSSYGLTVTGTTLSSNASGRQGGGIWTDNPTVVINSTFTGDISATGGSVYDSGAPSATILDTTIASNTATTALAGGGIANAAAKSALTVTNTIVADNDAGNCGSSAGLNQVTDGGHNLENGTSCGFADHAVNAEPQLGTLRDNGGPTLTMGITSSSPAYGVADPVVCFAAAPNGAGGADQRGSPRKHMPGCDIGAYEWVTASSITEGPQPTVPATGALSRASPVSATGLLVAAAGLALLGLVAVVGRRRRAQIP